MDHLQLSIDRHSSCSIPPTSQPSSFFPPTYKVVIVGNMGVGKTSLLWRYLFNEYRSIECRATIIDIERKKVSVRNKEVELEFWDTAGQERFRTISPSYYSGAHAIIVVYNIIDRESFSEVKQYWLKEIFGFFGEDATQRMPIMLVGNKVDVVSNYDDDEQVIVKKRDALELKGECGALLGPYECSAKSGSNVETAFLKMTEELVKRDTIGLGPVGESGMRQNCFAC